MAPKDTAAEFAFPPFRERWPWRGADLQMLRNFVVRPRPSFADAPPVERWFPMNDGTGDRLHGWLHEAPGRPGADGPPGSATRRAMKFTRMRCA